MEKKGQKEQEAPQINPVGRPKRPDKDNTQVPGRERGTKPGETRKGYIVSKELAGKIDAIAFWSHKKIKDAVQEAFTDYVAKWENDNGPVRIPNKIELTISNDERTPFPKGKFKITRQPKKS